jgi:hypothetical protein
MPRLFTAVLAILVVFVIGGQPAQSEEFFLFKHHKKVDRRVAHTAVGAGVVSTVAYWSLLDWSWNGKSSGYRWGAAGAVTAGCLVLSPMVAAAMVPERELTLREVYVLEGSCIVPIIGGLLVNAAFDAHPEWEAKPAKIAHNRRAPRG